MISLVGLPLSSGYGSTLASSAVSVYFGSSGHGEMSNLRVAEKINSVIYKNMQFPEL